MRKTIELVAELAKLLMIIALVLTLILYAALSVGIEFFQRYLGFYIDGGLNTIVGDFWTWMNEVMGFLSQYNVNHVFMVVSIIIGLALIELISKKITSKKNQVCFDE